MMSSYWRLAHKIHLFVLKTSLHIGRSAKSGVKSWPEEKLVVDLKVELINVNLLLSQTKTCQQ